MENQAVSQFYQKVADAWQQRLSAVANGERYEVLSAAYYQALEQAKAELISAVPEVATSPW